MATVKTNMSISTAGAKKPSDGAAAGASASQVSAKPKAPEAPKAPTAPTAPSAPKTQLAKEQKNLTDLFDYPVNQKPDEKKSQAGNLDYSKMNQPEKKPEAPTLNYAKINQINQKPPAPTLDYSKINARPEQSEPNVLNYKDMETKKPWTGAADKSATVNAKLESDAKMPALDALKAKRMFRQKYLREKVKKQETAPTPKPVSTQPLSGAGSQSNVARFNAGMNNQPGLVDTISSMFKGETLNKKQGVPSGVDPDKHERCVKKVKEKGHGKVSAIKICNASMNKDELQGSCEKSDLNISRDGSVSPVDRKSKMKKLKEITGKKTTPITKSEREFIQDDLLRPYTPYFNDVDELAKKEFHPLIQEFALHAAIQIGKGEKLSKSDPLDKYKIDKGGSLKFGTHVPTVGFPRNTLTTKETPRAGSDEGSGGEIKASKKYQMTKAEIQEDLKSDWQPKFKK